MVHISCSQIHHEISASGTSSHWCNSSMLVVGMATHDLKADIWSVMMATSWIWYMVKQIQYNKSRGSSHLIQSIPLTTVLSGNKEAREGTARFLCWHSAECSHFIFSNTVCVTTLMYYTAYLAPLALFPCRGVSRRTDKRTVCNRSFDRASWTTSLKTSLSHGPGCWDPEAQLLLSSSRRSETCGTEETGINEVSLSGAWYCL